MSGVLNMSNPNPIPGSAYPYPVPLVPSTHLGLDVDVINFRDAHGAPTSPPEDAAVTCDNNAVTVSLSEDRRSLAIRVADPTTLGRAVVSYTGNNGRLSLSVSVEMQPGGAITAMFDLGNVRLVARPEPQPELPLDLGPPATA